MPKTLKSPFAGFTGRFRGKAPMPPRRPLVSLIDIRGRVGAELGRVSLNGFLNRSLNQSLGAVLDLE